MTISKMMRVMKLKLNRNSKGSAHKNDKDITNEACDKLMFELYEIVDVEGIGAAEVWLREEMKPIYGSF